MKPKKTTKKSKKRYLWVATLLGGVIGGFYLYNYNPAMSAYRYVFACNNNDFEKAYTFYNQEVMESKFDKNEIIKVLEEQWGQGNKISPKSLTMIQDKKTKKWFVKFPYNLQSIYVFTPTGSTVYVDNKKVAQGIMGKGIEVKEMLPGKHQVRVEYNNPLYPPFITEIDVPKEIKVHSPYTTQNIVVAAPPGAWIKMGNMTKQNLADRVTFDNILPGQYELSVLMGDRDVEVFSQKTQIGKEDTIINLANIKGNQTVKEDLETFFNQFNRAYKTGIMNKDTTFLHKFLTEDINDGVISDFKLWYIDQKDVKDAKSLMEVRDVSPISGNELKTSVLETVYLVNREKDDVGKEVDQQYRVIIEWDYKLRRNKGSWQIINREIRQSIVAYKDPGGKWISY